MSYPARAGMESFVGGVFPRLSNVRMDLETSGIGNWKQQGRDDITNTQRYHSTNDSFGYKIFSPFVK